VGAALRRVADCVAGILATHVTREPPRRHRGRRALCAAIYLVRASPGPGA